MTHVTGIINLHREGMLASASLRSLVAAQTAAEAAGLDVELLAVADCSDVATREVARAFDRVRLIDTDVDDLGLARNVGIEAARGEFIAFLDGDDLWSDNWLIAAHDAARRDPRPTVWHPEASLFFGPGQPPTWRVHPSIESEDGDWVMLALRNHWTSASFGRRETYVEVPYRQTRLQAGYGYEDWSWNMEVVAHGHLHQPVQGTTHLIRVRETSLRQRTIAHQALVTPSTLFRSRIGWLSRSIRNASPMKLAAPGIEPPRKEMT